jgi:hypothetical protein
MFYAYTHRTSTCQVEIFCDAAQSVWETFAAFERLSMEIEIRDEGEAEKIGKQAVAANKMGPRCVSDLQEMESGGVKRIASLLVWPPERCDPQEKRYLAGRRFSFNPLSS